MNSKTIDMIRLHASTETYECSEHVPFSARRSRVESQSRGLNILIVGNDTGTLKRLNHLLVNYGYKVILSVDTNDALDVLEETRPSMVIVNSALPEVDGTRFLYAVKDIYPAAIRVMLTDHLDSELIAAINSKVVSLCVTRPFDGDILARSIRSLLEVISERTPEINSEMACMR